MAERIRVEFHCHTAFSKDSLTPPVKLVAECRRKGIDRLIITDHNTILGARQAQQIDPTLVIVGEEIMTARGEILAAYVTEEIPRGLPPFETIRRLRDQGAFISVSHPFDAMRNGHWAFEDLEAIAPLVDAIEVFNARCVDSRYNQEAVQFAQTHGLPGTAGSDAHAAFELGNACLSLPLFADAAGLRNVIAEGQVIGRLASPWVHFVSSFARIRKRIRV